MIMVPVFSPATESELMTVVAMLEAHEVHCFVHNAGFGGLHPGPLISSYNTRCIMVSEEDLPVALELIKDFRPPEPPPPVETPRRGKLRMLVESLLFGGFIPGGRRKE